MWLFFVELFASLAGEDSGESFEKNLDIAGNTPVINIKTIKAHDFFEIGDFATPRNLPEAGDAGFDADATFMVGRILVVFIDGGWTRAN